MIDKNDTPLDIFIKGWGRLGTDWGISKMMAEIYALLYMSPQPLTLEEMSDKLITSRSNISLNVRGLLDLGVVDKVIIRGERKDYYTAEDDIGKVSKLLAAAKKKKELNPAMEIVATALAAAEGTSESDFYRARLGELKRHLDFVDMIFRTFVGDGDDAMAGLQSIVAAVDDRTNRGS